MTKIEIELTEQQEKFLKEFASKQYDGAKDNVCTSNPIHVVQSISYRYSPYIGDDGEYFDEGELVFVWESEVEYTNAFELVQVYFEDYEEDELIVPLKSFDEVYLETVTDVYGDEIFVADYEDYFKLYGIDDVKVLWRTYEWNNVAFFFILDEAKRYIQYQRHNLRQPRTYTFSEGYSNYGDFVPFRNLLLSIGEKLNKEEKYNEFN